MMDIKALLEDQEAVVVAAHVARVEALKKYGAFSEQYRTATRVYDDELRRYQGLKLDVQIQRSHEEMQELGQVIGRYFSQLQARLHREFRGVTDQGFIDVTPERTESGYQHPLSDNALPQEIAEILEEGRRYLEITASEKPMLPKPKSRH